MTLVDGRFIADQHFFFAFVSFFPISPNVTTHLSCVLLSFFFNFSANVFYGLFLSLTLLQKFCMFSIQSFNYNLSYIIFFNLILILLISHFNPWLFCQSFNCFLFCHSIKVYAILFQFSPHSFNFFLLKFFPFFFQFNRPIKIFFFVKNALKKIKVDLS
jgi:hypothetical protein